MGYVEAYSDNLTIYVNALFNSMLCDRMFLFKWWVRKVPQHLTNYACRFVNCVTLQGTLRTCEVFINLLNALIQYNAILWLIIRQSSFKFYIFLTMGFFVHVCKLIYPVRIVV